MTAFKDRLLDLHQRLGWARSLALALLVGGAMLYALAIKPLERERDLLQAKLDTTSQRRVAAELQRTSVGTPAAKLAVFHAFFAASEEPTDYLARLYGL